MVHDPDILNLLESLQITAWRGTVFRHMFADFPPTRTNDNGARWNPPGVSAIYTSTERDTVLAEAEHRISLEPFRPRAKRTIYSLAVELGVVIDLRDPQLLVAVGISEATLVQLDFRPCQAIGAAVRFLGADGLLVPSARAVGTNLVIFPHEDIELEVIGSEVIQEGLQRL
jgi:RES domain-containing protein